MKKLIGISLGVFLAVSPLMAMAEDEAPSTTLTASNTDETGKTLGTTGVVVAADPYYTGKTITDTDRATTASAAYVKGAYNDSIAAVNAVHKEAEGLALQMTTALGTVANTGLTNLSANGKANVSAQGTVDLTKNDYAANTVGKAIVDVTNTAATAVQNVKVNNVALNEDSNGDVNVTITTGETAGTISVNGSDVAVNGVLTQHQSLTDYAKKTGVTNTISNSDVTGTVPIMETWGDDTPTTIAIDASITGATYSE